MVFQKTKIGLLTGLLCLLGLLCSCGAKPLAEREIIRAVFFEEEGPRCTAVLLLQDPDAAEEKSSNPATRTARGAGDTPAAALRSAEQTLQGSPYYGLMDLAALPKNSTWQTVETIGELLYTHAQPTPEIAVVLLGDTGAQPLEKSAQELYKNWQAAEKTYALHCGLERVFAQNAQAAIPRMGRQGYGVCLLGEGTRADLNHPLTAQLAAVLNGMSRRLACSYGEGTAACRAQASASFAAARVGQATGIQIKLRLRGTKLEDLSAAQRGEQALQTALEQELQQAFLGLHTLTQVQNIDLFHLAFRLQPLTGSADTAAAVALQVEIEK